VHAVKNACNSSATSYIYILSPRSVSVFAEDDAKLLALLVKLPYLCRLSLELTLV